MFNNIGKKVKTIVTIECWIEILASIIAAVIIIKLDKDLVLLGVGIIVLGSVNAWLNTILHYGYGQLIDNTDRLVDNTNKLLHHFTVDPDNSIESKDKNYNKRGKSHDDKLAAKLNRDFVNEILHTPTADLQLILEDQQDVYSSDELDFIKEVLDKRCS